MLSFVRLLGSQEKWIEKSTSSFLMHILLWDKIDLIFLYISFSEMSSLSPVTYFQTFKLEWIRRTLYIANNNILWDNNLAT
jgi:hypothetical protein